MTILFHDQFIIMTFSQLNGNFQRRTPINEAKKYPKASTINTIASIAERFKLLYTTFKHDDGEEIQFVADNVTPGDPALQQDFLPFQLDDKSSHSEQSGNKIQKLLGYHH